MSERRDRHREAYKEEAYELLNELEESLLELEADPGDMDVIGRVFRAMHTIKGSGAMFGFDQIAAFAHEVENVFDLVRGGRLKATRDLINLTLEARDHLREMLDLSDEQGGGGIDEAAGRRILSGLRAMVPGALLEEARAAAPAAAPVDSAHAGAPSATEYTYLVRFRPSPDIFLKGSNPALLVDELAHMGKSHVMADSSSVPQLDDLDPELCHTSWSVIITTDRDSRALRDVFMFVEDESEISVELIGEGGIGSSEQMDYGRLGRMLVERGTITREDLLAARKERRAGQLIIDEAAGERLEADAQRQQARREARSQREGRDLANTVRVPASKLDRLVNLVGELVTVQARLTQTTGQKKDPVLIGIAEEIEQLTAELHDNAMNIRMVQIGSTFSKFRRLVRDLSGSLMRDVILSTEGAETELDKTVIDRLNDPLVHIIRNCMDHGIEPPDERAAAGKPRQGHIRLSARHSGADVLISVRDDGAGIDRERVLAKAVDKGLVKPEESLSDHDILNLIFAPGFSTAERVTDVSGRGVGMDVVKRNIEAFRGSVDVTSERGRGTTITLRIPLTLAIIEGLLFAVGGERYVVPLSVVEECVELTEADLRAAHGRSMVNVRGDLVPYISIRGMFGISAAAPKTQQVVIMNHEGMRVGFSVDYVVGEHQTVIKSLSRVFRNVRSVSGATILGNGSVALILDTPRIIEDAVEQERLSVAEIRHRSIEEPITKEQQ